jgi:5'-3' exonuclease
MIKGGATHAVATDHVIESFRNGLWPGYKTGEGIEPDLLAQFPLLEDVLSAGGIVVWPMVEFEADDALAAAALAAARDVRVERVIICTPDKDLAQCVSGTRLVQLNRRTRVTLDEAGVVQKFGVSPAQSPIIWPWWAMQSMATRVCQAGGRSRRLPSLPSFSISKPSLWTIASGA